MPDKFAEFKTIGLVNALRSCQLFTGLPLIDLERSDCETWEGTTSLSGHCMDDC